MNRIDALMTPASEDLDAARLLAARGHERIAVSRADYAASAALLVLGGARSKHSGVVSAFGRLLVLDHGLDREAGRSLRRLFEERAEADYDELHGVDADDASAALDDAAMVVDDVTGVRDRASEPVQLGDHESVAGAACGHRFTQSPDGPGGCR